MTFNEEYGIDDDGVVYQKNIKPFNYDKDYLKSYVKIKEKCRLLSKIRLNFLNKNVKKVNSLLDYGSGTGEFLETASEQLENVYSLRYYP